MRPFSRYPGEGTASDQLRRTPEKESPTGDGRKQTGSFAMPISLKQTSCQSNANASHRPTQAFPSHLDGESSSLSTPPISIKSVIKSNLRTEELSTSLVVQC
jgi:hypothetical protein